MQKKPGQQGTPKVNWIDERQDSRGNLRVMQGFAQMRADRVYTEAQVCEACQQARAAEGEDALCEQHLAEALGMHSEW